MLTEVKVEENMKSLVVRGDASEMEGCATIKIPLIRIGSVI